VDDTWRAFELVSVLIFFFLKREVLDLLDSLDNSWGDWRKDIRFGDG
jgi:hypothetical protein